MTEREMEIPVISIAPPLGENWGDSEIGYYIVRQKNMQFDERKVIRAGDLKAMFADVPDDTEVSFGPADGEYWGSLAIFRLKWRGDNFLNVEFNEIFDVTHDPWKLE